MHTISKTFHFDSCHMLDGHKGKCHHLHGHSYRLVVEVTGELQTEGASQEMVLDFAELKQIVNQHIVHPFDHAFLYCENNENERKLAEMLQSMQRKVVAFPCRTTAESLSQFIFHQLIKYLPVSKVILWETAESCCQYQVER